MKERARKQEELRQEGKTKNLLMTLGASLGIPKGNLDQALRLDWTGGPKKQQKTSFFKVLAY